MTNVNFKYGNKSDLASSYESGVLIFTETGEVFRGMGTGNALKKFGDVYYGFTDLADLQIKNPATQGKLYLTENYKLYTYSNGIYELVTGADALTSVDASIVEYDNTSSTLTSENVQSALTELDNKINGVTSGMAYKGTVADKAELDALTNVENGQLYIVLADETHNDGRTLYVYSDITDTFEFLGLFEFAENFIDLLDTPNVYVDGKFLKSSSSGIVFGEIDWSDIQNKPSSTVSQIDQAVTDSHTHSNKTVLDKFSENVDGEPEYNGQSLVLKWDEFSL